MNKLRNELSKGLADGIYLKLNCSNDPLTGTLQCQDIDPRIAGIYSIGTSTKGIKEIWLNYDITGKLYFGNTDAFIQSTPFYGLGLLRMWGGAAVYLTINSQVDSTIDISIGSGIAASFRIGSGSTYYGSNQTKFIVYGSDDGGVEIVTGAVNIISDTSIASIFQFGSIGSAQVRFFWLLGSAIIDTNNTGPLQISANKLILHGSYDVIIGNSADNKYLKFGADKDAGIKYDGNDLIIDTDLVGSGGCKINTMEIDKDGFVRPVTLADASAPNGSTYYSSDSSKLVYKDSGGIVNDLY